MIIDTTIDLDFTLEINFGDNILVKIIKKIWEFIKNLIGIKGESIN